MTTGKHINHWSLISVFLIVIITVASVIIWARHSRSQPVVISPATEPELQGEIYISGSIANPGYYPLTSGDSIADIILAAGGATDNANLNEVRIYIHETEKETQSQKVNLNQAEAWLLEALPGIGETRARAIIDYREQNGGFNHVTELLKVEGIGTNTYEKIKSLITVAD